MSDETNPLLLITDTPLPLVEESGVRNADNTDPHLSIKKVSGKEKPRALPIPGMFFIPGEVLGKQFQELQLEDELDLRFNEIML